MTTQLFTVYDTDYDLSDPEDCQELCEHIEMFGKVYAWKLYDLIKTVEQTQGCEDDYYEFLQNIKKSFNRVVDIDRELVTDDCAAKTILSIHSPVLCEWLRGDQQTALMGTTEHFTLDIGCATEANYVPVQQVAVTENSPLLVTRVLEPVRGSDGLTRIGNIGDYSVVVFKVNISGHSQWQYGFKHPDPNADVPDEIFNIAQCMFREFLEGDE